MDQGGGPCIPVSGFRGVRLTSLNKKMSGPPSTASTETVQFDPASRFVTPGSVGGSFSSRTQVLSVTLPSLHNDFYVPSRGTRKQTLSSNRFVPTKGRWLPGPLLSPRDRLKVDHELLQLAKQRNRISMQVVPHRSEQPYLMAGFPVKLQSRSLLTPDLHKMVPVQTPAQVFPPQPSLVNETDRVNSTFLGQNNESGTSEMFLTQTSLDQAPILMNDITVTKCHNYQSPCSLLSREGVMELSREFRQVALEADSLSYSLAEALVQDTNDPSHAVQVLDLNRDGLVDIREYVVVRSLYRHYYKSDKATDYRKLNSKLNSLRSKYEGKTKPTIVNILNGISKLLISPPLMESLLSLVNCNPTAHMTFMEFLCLVKFWEELEESLFEEEITAENEVLDYVTSYVGATDSSLSFDEILSTTQL